MIKTQECMLKLFPKFQSTYAFRVKIQLHLFKIESKTIYITTKDCSMLVRKICYYSRTPIIRTN